MAQPTPSDVHVNAPLTNISIAFLQDMGEFIADRVFPNIPVQKQSDRYFLYPKGNWFRTAAKPRGLSQESAGSGFDIDNTPNYMCNVQALHKDIDDQLRANADAPINLDSDATEFVTRGLALKREFDWAAKFFTSGIWKGSSTGTDITPATKWDADGSTPIKDLRTEITAMKTKTGFKPNKLIMGEDVWNTLADHEDFLERVTITKDKIVMPSLLASILGLDEVIIAGAILNIAQEKATDDLKMIFQKNALLCYAAPRPSLMVPSAGYTFSWTGYLGAGAQGQRILRFRLDHLRSDRIEGEMAYDQKVVSDELGVFFLDAIS